MCVVAVSQSARVALTRDNKCNNKTSKGIV